MSISTPPSPISPAPSCPIRPFIRSMANPSPRFSAAKRRRCIAARSTTISPAISTPAPFPCSVIIKQTAGGDRYKLFYSYEDQHYEMYNLTADLSEAKNLLAVPVNRPPRSKWRINCTMILCDWLERHSSAMGEEQKDRRKHADADSRSKTPSPPGTKSPAAPAPARAASKRLTDDVIHPAPHARRASPAGSPLASPPAASASPRVTSSPTTRAPLRSVP